MSDIVWRQTLVSLFFRHFFHSALHWCLRSRWFTYPNIRYSTPRGKHYYFIKLLYVHILSPHKMYKAGDLTFSIKLMNVISIFRLYIPFRQKIEYTATEDNRTSLCIVFLQQIREQISLIKTIMNFKTIITPSCK